MTKSLRILKKISLFVLALAFVGLLFYAPMIYSWASSPSGTPDQEEAVCRYADETGHEASTLRKIALDFDPLKNPLVGVRGKLSYAPVSQSFYLRDGVFSVPVSLSGCRDFDAFKEGETVVMVKGVVAARDGRPIIAVHSVRETVPRWVQFIADAGLLGLWGLAVSLLTLLFQFFSWLGVLIGLRKRKEPPSPAFKLNQHAGASLVAGIAAPLFWIVSPAIGLFFHVVGLVRGRLGLRSQKRRVAVAGLILCGIGLLVIPLVYASTGKFLIRMEPFLYPFFFEQSTSSAVKRQAEAERAIPDALETGAYLNDKAGISLHPPKGWTLTENDQGNATVLTFLSPKPDEEGKKRFPASIVVFSGPTEGQHVGAIIEQTKAGALAAKGEVFEDAVVPLGGGNVGHLLGLSLEQSGMKLRMLIALAEKGEKGYAVSVIALASAWDRHQETLRASLLTFEPRGAD